MNIYSTHDTKCLAITVAGNMPWSHTVVVSRSLVLVDACPSPAMHGLQKEVL